jgi:cytochrome P450
MIPAGTFVLPPFVLANRNENRFPNPDGFDVTRNTEGQMA